MRPAFCSRPSEVPSRSRTPASVGEAFALRFAEDHRQQSDLGAVDVEDVSERRRDDRFEAEVLERPGCVLTRGAAAEVASRHKDRIGLQLDLPRSHPVIEQELAEATSLDPLQELLRNDLVGVDVGPVEHRDAAFDHIYGTHAVTPNP